MAGNNQLWKFWNSDSLEKQVADFKSKNSEIRDANIVDKSTQEDLIIVSPAEKPIKVRKPKQKKQRTEEWQADPQTSGTVPQKQTKGTKKKNTKKKSNNSKRLKNSPD